MQTSHFPTHFGALSHWSHWKIRTRAAAGKKNKQKKNKRESEYAYMLYPCVRMRFEHVCVRVCAERESLKITGPISRPASQSGRL